MDVVARPAERVLYGADDDGRFGRRRLDEAPDQTTRADANSTTRPDNRRADTRRDTRPHTGGCGGARPSSAMTRTEFLKPFGSAPAASSLLRSSRLPASAALNRSSSARRIMKLRKMKPVLHGGGRRQDGATAGAGAAGGGVKRIYLSSFGSSDSSRTRAGGGDADGGGAPRWSSQGACRARRPHLAPPAPRARVFCRRLESVFWHVPNCQA